jgi:hypothetical protein
VVLPKKPEGTPWDRVLDWNSGTVALGSGDYVVWGIQFHVSNGEKLSYPHLTQLTAALVLPCMLCQESSKTDPKGWIASVITRFVECGKSTSPPEPFKTVAIWDTEYIREYYRPYFEENVDAFAAQRMGQRAALGNETWATKLPAVLENMLSQMKPEDREAVKKRFAGSMFDIDETIALGRKSRQT